MAKAAAKHDPGTIGTPGPRPRTTRRRRTKAQIHAVKAAITDILAAQAPMTCRQMYYRLVAHRIIEKTEPEYQKVVRLLSQMRLAGEAAWSDIADATRWVRIPRMHSSAERALHEFARGYRRNLWNTQPVYVEIWLEKDALAGVLVDVTAEWGVPLMVSRGYPSLSYLQRTAGTIREQDRPCYLYQFGDHDPSGVNIAENIDERLRAFAPDAKIHFERVAVTPEQIEGWALPTRPTKRTDTRSRNFAGDSVDVDAIEPDTLRRLCEECITRHLDAGEWERMRRIEKAERESVLEYAKQYEADGLCG